MDGLPPMLLFGWGTLGGIAMAVAVFAVPTLLQLAMTTGPLPDQWTRAFLVALVVVAVGIAAGIVALALPDTTTRQEAILVGLASQAILKGLSTAAREASLPFLRP